MLIRKPQAGSAGEASTAEPETQEQAPEPGHLE